MVFLYLLVHDRTEWQDWAIGLIDRIEWQDCVAGGGPPAGDLYAEK